jgi:hypothetical protein
MFEPRAMPTSTGAVAGRAPAVDAACTIGPEYPASIPADATPTVRKKSRRPHADDRDMSILASM